MKAQLAIIRKFYIFYVWITDLKDIEKKLISDALFTSMRTEQSVDLNSILNYNEFEPVPDRIRKNNSSELFTLWFASNLTIGDFAIGFIPVLLGLSLGIMLASYFY